MDKSELTEQITIKLTKDQKAFLIKQQPNMSEWLRGLIKKEIKKDTYEPMTTRMVDM